MRREQRLSQRMPCSCCHIYTLICRCFKQRLQKGDGAEMNLVHTVYEPPGDGPFPTLIAIHGWGASAFDLLGIAPYIAGGQFLMLCPQGPLGLVADGIVQGFGWYPLSLDK